MLILKNVTIKNFLSTGQNPLKFDLHKHKTTLMSGDNGAGKSTLVDAICFALFGKAFRNINKPQLINIVNKKQCVVTIDFSVGNNEFHIVRGMKPTIFQIFKNGDLIDQDAAARDYQEMLERDILNMSYNAFCQVIVLGNANWTAFMSLSAGDRRKVLEDMLGIEIFTVMSTLLKEQQNNLRNDIKDIDANIKVLENTIELNEKHKASLLQHTEEAIQEKKNKIADFEKQLVPAREKRDELASKMSDIEKVLSKEESTKDEMSGLVDEVNKIEHAEKQATKDIKFYVNNSSCPTCKREIDPKFRTVAKQEREAHLAKIGERKNLHTTQIDVLTGRLNKFKKLGKGLAQLSSQHQDVVLDIHTWTSAITQLHEDIESLREEKPPLDPHDYRADLDVELKKKSDLIDKKDVQSVALDMLKDDGIKAQIIKQYIPVINTLVNRYLERLNFFVKFHLNEKFEMEIKALHKDDMSYDNFSQGEKMRIDLSILFTWRDIIRQKKMNSCNLLILDEIMDSSLDPQGTEDFLEVIRALTPDNNIFIISHKRDQISDKFDNVLEIVKKKNFSRIKR